MIWDILQAVATVLGLAVIAAGGRLLHRLGG